MARGLGVVYSRYKIIRQFKIVMAQLSKRSLRERRAPKNFDSDNEEQDPWGYSKPSYSKEQKNPTQQLNSEAKLLVKFLSAINKSYRDHQTDHRRKEAEAIKEPVPLREKKPRGEGEAEGQRRQGEAGREVRIDTRKGKDGYNPKPQNSAMDAQNFPRSQSFLSKCKALNSESAKQMLNIEHTLARNRPATNESVRLKLEKMQTAAKPLEGNAFRASPPQPFPNGKSEPTSSKSHFFAVGKQKSKRMEEIQASLNIPKPTIAQNKIFKRSAYHIAIAYHIYLKKIQDKGTIGNEIDPTYFARKLKEGINK